jgi:hypothetical protein
VLLRTGILLLSLLDCFRQIDLICCSAKLDGSMLGKNTKVGAKSELMRCITQAGYEVMPGGAQ